MLLMPRPQWVQAFKAFSRKGRPSLSQVVIATAPAQYGPLDSTNQEADQHCAAVFQEADLSRLASSSSI